MIIKLWNGTNALTLIRFPPGKKIWYLRIIVRRIYWKLFKGFYKHYVKGIHLKDYLIKFGVDPYDIEVWKVEPYYHNIVKEKHDGFNILYYYPGDRGNPKFKRWVYGFDIYLDLSKRIKGVNWIVVDGSYDMREVYPIIDYYIRPSRHDGDPRMIKECQHYGIPYYWSKTFEPNTEDIIKHLELISGISLLHNVVSRFRIRR